MASATCVCNTIMTVFIMVGLAWMIIGGIMLAEIKHVNDLPQMRCRRWPMRNIVFSHNEKFATVESCVWFNDSCVFDVSIKVPGTHYPDLIFSESNDWGWGTTRRFMEQNSVERGAGVDLTCKVDCISCPTTTRSEPVWATIQTSDIEPYETMVALCTIVVFFCTIVLCVVNIRSSRSS